MKYEISLSKDKKYIRIRAFETIDGDMEKQLSEKAIIEGKKHSVWRFLVDARGTRNIATTYEQ